MIVVDRVEGTRAVLEMDGELVDVPLSALPPGVKEGAVLAVSMGAADPAAAAARLARLKARTPPGKGEFDL